MADDTKKANAEQDIEILCTTQHRIVTLNRNSTSHINPQQILNIAS